MCRNIKKLRRPERLPADSELEDASLQFVRKISGYGTPSQKNQVAFEAAVHEIAAGASVRCDDPCGSVGYAASFGRNRHSP